MKKIISIVTAGFIFLSCSTVFATGQKVTLTIETAQKTALEKSKQAVIDDLNIKVKEIVLKDSKYDLLPDSGPTLDNAYKTGVEPIEVETNLELAKRAKTENLQTLNYNVFKVAVDILLVQKELETENQKLKILKDKYTIIQAKYKQKVVTENDVNDAEYNLDNKKNDVSKIEDSLEAVKLELQKLLDMPVNEVLVDVKDDIKYEGHEKADVNSIVTKVLETDTTVYEKSQNVKIKEKNLENINHYFKQGNSTYDNAFYDLQIAKLELSDARVSLETNIKNKYNDLLNQQGKVELAQKYATLMTKKFTAAEAKYKNGTLNKESYLSEKEKYLDAVYQKYVAIHDYNLLKVEFENLIS